MESGKRIRKVSTYIMFVVAKSHATNLPLLFSYWHGKGTICCPSLQLQWFRSKSLPLQHTNGPFFLQVPYPSHGHEKMTWPAMPAATVFRPCSPKETHERIGESCKVMKGFVNAACLVYGKVTRHRAGSGGWKGVLRCKFWTETCNKFVADGNEETWYRFAAAENVALEGKTPANRDVNLVLPGNVHYSPFSRPVLSKRSVRSKTFFSSNIFSMVESPFSMVPVGRKSIFCYECWERLPCISAVSLSPVLWRGLNWLRSNLWLWEI